MYGESILSLSLSSLFSLTSPKWVVHTFILGTRNLALHSHQGSGLFPFSVISSTLSSSLGLKLNCRHLCVWIMRKRGEYEEACMSCLMAQTESDIPTTHIPSVSTLLQGCTWLPIKQRNVVSSLRAKAQLWLSNVDEEEDRFWRATNCLHWDSREGYELCEQVLACHS